MAKILVVDDKMISQLILETILRRDNHTVIISDNGQDALSALADNQIDLVITEIMFRGTDGIALLRQMRAERSKEDLPVIVLTAESATKWRPQAMQLGADIIYGKPIGSQELLETVDKLLESSVSATAKQDMQTPYLHPRLGWA